VGHTDTSRDVHHKGRKATPSAAGSLPDALCVMPNAVVVLAHNWSD